MGSCQYGPTNTVNRVSRCFTLGKTTTRNSADLFAGIMKFHPELHLLWDLKGDAALIPRDKPPIDTVPPTYHLQSL